MATHKGDSYSPREVRLMRQARDAALDEAAKVAMDMPLQSGEERHDYRWTDTFKAAALDISSAIKALKAVGHTRS